MKELLKKVFFRLKYRTCRIYGDCSLQTKFEGYNVVHKHAKFNGEMGLGSYIGPNSDINANIGRFCSIGSNVKTVLSNHPSRVFVSTSPSFYSTKKQNGLSFVVDDSFEEILYFDKEKKVHVSIGNDVWICDNVTILGGIKIGNGAIIGANAVVTKDVAPYEVVVGNPAKVIRKRFNDEDIDLLERAQWWNRDLKWLKRHAYCFKNIELFKQVVKGND